MAKYRITSIPQYAPGGETNWPPDWMKRKKKKPFVDQGAPGVMDDIITFSKNPVTGEQMYPQATTPEPLVINQPGEEFPLPGDELSQEEKWARQEATRPIVTQEDIDFNQKMAIWEAKAAARKKIMDDEIEALRIKNEKLAAQAWQDKIKTRAEEFKKKGKHDKLDPFDSIPLLDYNDRIKNNPNYAKELESQGYFVNINKDRGYVELFPAAEIQSRIFKNGLKTNEIVNKLGVGTTKSIEKSFGTIMAQADQYHSAQTKNFMIDLMKKGMSRDAAINYLINKKGLARSKEALEELYSKDFTEIEKWAKSFIAYSDDYIKPYQKGQDLSLVNRWTDNDLITLAKDRDFIDGRGANIDNISPNYSDNPDWGAEVMRALRTGKYGWKPKSNMLIKLWRDESYKDLIVEPNEADKASIEMLKDYKTLSPQSFNSKYTPTIDQLEQKWKEGKVAVKIEESDAWRPNRMLVTDSNKKDAFGNDLSQFYQYSFEVPSGVDQTGKIITKRVTPDEMAGQTVYMTKEEAEKYNKAMVSDNMYDLQTKLSLWHLPGAIAFGGATAMTALPALTHAPIASAPWLTAGNALDAYFVYETLKPQGFAQKAYDSFSEGKIGEGIENTVWGGLGLIPLIKPALGTARALNELGKPGSLGVLPVNSQYSLAYKTPLQSGLLIGNPNLSRADEILQTVTSPLNKFTKFANLGEFKILKQATRGLDNAYRLGTAETILQTSRTGLLGESILKQELTTNLLSLGQKEEALNAIGFNPKMYIEGSPAYNKLLEQQRLKDISEVSSSSVDNASESLIRFKNQFESGSIQKIVGAGGARNKGIYEIDGKIVKLTGSGKGVGNAEELKRLSERVKDMPNVHVPQQTIKLNTLNEKSLNASIMTKAPGKEAGELTSVEIENIPKEHWDKFEKDTRLLSERGIQTDFTNKNNLFYDKESGFHFIDIGGASVDGSSTGKFFMKNGVEYYVPFEKYKGFPKEFSKERPFTGGKDMFKNISSVDEVKLVANPKESLSSPNAIETPAGFQNRLFDSNIQLGSFEGKGHLSEVGYNYRTLGAGEIEAIKNTKGVYPKAGKAKGGNENVKYWTKGNNKNWYGENPNQQVIRVKDNKFSTDKVVDANDIEIFNHQTGNFEAIELSGSPNASSVAEPFEIAAKRILNSSNNFNRIVKKPDPVAKSNYVQQEFAFPAETSIVPEAEITGISAKAANEQKIMEGIEQASLTGEQTSLASEQANALKASAEIPKTYPIPNPDYFTHLLSMTKMSAADRKFYTSVVDTVKAQGNMASDFQKNMLERIRSGNFNFSGSKGNINAGLSPELITSIAGSKNVVGGKLANFMTDWGLPIGSMFSPTLDAINPIGTIGSKFLAEASPLNLVLKRNKVEGATMSIGDILSAGVKNGKVRVPKSFFKKTKDLIKKSDDAVLTVKNNKTNADIYRVKFDPAVEGSNFKVSDVAEKKGIFGRKKNADFKVTSKEDIPLTEVNLEDPGITVFRRIPFTNRYAVVDKATLIEGKAQWATTGASAQKFAESFGKGLIITGATGALVWAAEPSEEEKKEAQTKWVKDEQTKAYDNAVKQHEIQVEVEKNAKYEKHKAYITTLITNAVEKGNNQEKIIADLHANGISAEDLIQIYIDNGVPKEEAENYINTVIRNDIFNKKKGGEILDLTENEINEYKKGGWIVERIN
jgi:hypothetical protein